MSTDDWQSLGVVCCALLALLTLIVLIWRKVVRPVWRAAWRTIRRLNEVADDLLGDQAKHIPSMTERMTAMEKKLDEHLTWHAPAGNGAAAQHRPQTRRS